MAKTTVTPWSSVTAKTITGTKLYPAGLATNFAVVDDAAGNTVVKNVSSPVDLEEKIVYRYQDIDRVSTSCATVYPRSTKNGYQFVLKDEYICRTTDSVTGEVTDDPVVLYLTVRTTKGNNAMRTGNDVLAALERLLSVVIDINSSDAVDSTQATLDRIMRGATKPSVLV